MSGEKNTHGGKREGAGRPKGSVNKTHKENTKDECIYVRCTSEEKERLQELAEKENISMSVFILKKCFGG